MEPTLYTEHKPPLIGMSKKEIQAYSLRRAMLKASDISPLSGLEKEASDATEKVTGKRAIGFFVPYDVLIANIRADLSSGDATKGGYTVDTHVLDSSMIELLRNKPLVAQLGATTLSGLKGNIMLTKYTAGGTAYWLPETGSVTKSDITLGQLSLTPHRLCADMIFSKELLIQSTPDAEQIIRDDIAQELAIEKDRAAINGLGAAGEPKGIISTTGVKSVTFGAAPTWAKIVDFETQIAAANAAVARMAYLTSPSVRGVWKTSPKVTGQAIFLWEKGLGLGVGEVNGYPAHATNQVPDNKVVFGNWADLIFADWAPIDVVVDPFSLKKTGQIEATFTTWTDIGIRHPESFCVSTDAGNQ